MLPSLICIAVLQKQHDTHELSSKHNAYVVIYKIDFLTKMSDYDFKGFKLSIY
jgi:hypothetical protein